MPIKKFAKKEDIPEELQADALELADGTFAVDEPVDDSAARQTLAEVKRKLDAAEKLSTKLAKEAAEAETARKAAEQGITGEQLAKIRAEVRAETETEFAPQLAAAAAAATELRVLKVDTQVKQIALKNGVRAERIDQWWRLHGHHYDLTADGKTIVVKGEEGVSVDKHIGKMKDEVPEFYKGTEGAGGGGTGGGAGGGGRSGMVSDPLVNPTAALAEARAAGKTE